jgi:hypothetical protein
MVSLMWHKSMTFCFIIDAAHKSNQKPFHDGSSRHGFNASVMVLLAELIYDGDSMIDF